ncbi:MAG: tetratricopeptide repeat protein [Myxococcota bacterium]|nr:tetratricopeptide repeat protein [Myxococcota bacterium]
MSDATHPGRARRRAWICALAVCLAPTFVHAQEACVPPEAAISCEGVEAARPARRRAPPSALPSATPSARPSGETAPGIEIDPTRGAETPPRARGLLERELTVLERLAQRTGPSDPRHADVLERLAMTHDELRRESTGRARALDGPVHRAEGAERQRLEDARRHLEQDARVHRDGAIRALARVVADHPDRRDLDVTLYTLALHLEAIGQRSRARMVYQRLLRAFPQSRFVPQAWLAFAEHAFAGGDLDAAEQLYERVLGIPPARNPVFGYARYKLAWVRYNREDFRGSLDAFVQLLAHLRDHPDETNADALARQARRELVLPYARVARPDRALAFFRRVAAGEAEAFEMLESLGALYHDTGQWTESAGVHRQLIAERPGGARCRWQLRVLDATIASAPKAAQRQEAERLIATAPGACGAEAATTLVLLATAWHREAVGTEDQPGTRDAATLREAEAMYGLVLDAYPRFDALTLDRIDARDRPTRAQLHFHRADLLFEMQRWSACAASFEATLDAAPGGQLAADAAYGAVLCYDRHLGSREPPGTPSDEALTARALTAEEARMARTFHRFACAAPEHPERPVVLYRWARLHYEANRFADAAALFERVALDHPDSEVGPFAANLWLDSLGVLAERRGQAVCFDALRAAIPRVEAAHCPRHAEVCEALAPLSCRLGAQEAYDAAEAGRHREAAEAYVALARRRCDEAPRYLYNAAIAFEAARLLGRAIRVRAALVRAYPERRELAIRALHQNGASYHALAMYGLAAEHYQRYAEAHASCAPLEGQPCPDPAEGLQDAVLFRMGLGQTDEALEAAALAARLLGRRRPEAVARIDFAVGALFEGDPRRLTRHYADFIRRHARHATPSQLARAHVLAARGWLALERVERAEPGWRAAIAIHERGGEEAALALEGTDEERQLELTLLRDAASEAHYQLAEQRRRAFEALRFPTFHGTATVIRVQRWSERELRPWLEEKQARLAAAEEAYARVAPLGIPRWRIAAASRLGDMRAELASQLLESPVPDAIARDDELLALYEAAILEVVHPIERAAIERYEHCLTAATRARWFDARSRHCEEALNRLDAARFPIASELRGEVGYRFAPPAAPPAALRGG